MHELQILWTNEMKTQHPECFKNIKVLDVGSLDVNGNNRQFFNDCEYIGIDVIKGPNVDIVSPCHEWETDQLFDTIISTSALEHDMYYGKTLIKMYELLKPGGWLFICTCYHNLITLEDGTQALGLHWKEHGTKTSSPLNSGTSQIDENNWSNYYRNIRKEDFNILIPFEEKFSFSTIDIERSKKKDIHFVAQKII